MIYYILFILYILYILIFMGNVTTFFTGKSSIGLSPAIRLSLRIPGSSWACLHLRAWIFWKRRWMEPRDVDFNNKTWVSPTNVVLPIKPLYIVNIYIYIYREQYRQIIIQGQGKVIFGGWFSELCHAFRGRSPVIGIRCATGFVYYRWTYKWGRNAMS